MQNKAFRVLDYINQSNYSYVEKRKIVRTQWAIEKHKIYFEKMTKMPLRPDH